jgi:vitamin B12 transporter
VVNLSASYRVAADWTIFARANNIFDKDYELVRDFATPGTNVFVGVRYSPK